MKSKQPLSKSISLLLCGLVIAGAITTAFAAAIAPRAHVAEQPSMVHEWQRMKGVQGENVKSLEKNNGLLYMGTESGQLFTEDESGYRNIITVVYNGQAVSGFHDIYFDGNTVYLATDAGLLRSTDNLQTFDMLHPARSMAVYASGDLVTLVLEGRVLQSDDGGVRWRILITTPANILPNKILYKGDMVVITGISGFLLSRDKGRNWVPSYYRQGGSYLSAVSQDQLFFAARDMSRGGETVIVRGENDDTWHVVADLSSVLFFSRAEVRAPTFLAVDDQGTMYVGIYVITENENFKGYVYALAPGAGAKDWKQIYSSPNALSQLKLINDQLTLAEANTGRVFTYDRDNNTWRFLASVGTPECGAALPSGHFETECIYK